MVVDDVEMEEEIKPLLPKMLLATVFNTAIDSTPGLAGNSIPTPCYALDSSRLNLTFKFWLKHKYRNDNSVVFFCAETQMYPLLKEFIWQGGAWLLLALSRDSPERVTSPEVQQTHQGHHLLEASSTQQGPRGKNTCF